MAKVVCVLYDDPADGYPKSYARDDLPKIDHYPGGQALPAPNAIDFKPGSLLGSVSGELGLRKFLESQGHTFVVTSDKDGPNSVFERELADAEVVISQPFCPAYLTAERIAKAPKLKLALTAGVGSDHIDLEAAIYRGITVAEVTSSTSISAAEHAVMMILGLVRNYIPSYQWVVKGGWNIADCAMRSYDVEGMHAGTVAVGRIGLAIMHRLKPFGMYLHYYDRHRLPEWLEKKLSLIWHPSVEDMVKVCDVVTINAPLHAETENLFDEKMLSKMKRGAYLINTARGKLCDRDAVVHALESGRLAGYAGDVWFPQPAPKDHPWRTMPHHGMTPHFAGSSLSAQARYAAGIREILECWFEGRPIREEYLIVHGGKLAGTGAYSYSVGSATGNSEEARAHVRHIMTLGELTASIAHEVNQPLTGIIINGETCLRFLNQDPPQLDELRGAIEDMISDGRRASEVIRRLRALSRKDDPEHGLLDLNEVVHESLPLVQRELANHRIALKLALAPDLPAVFGDRVQLQQVITNFMINAIQSMSQVTERARDLVIRSGRDDGGVHLSVTDSGTGISPETMQKLFSAFFTTKPSGMGMGLSICCSIIEAHNGRIQASNNDGHGATLQFVLPIQKQRTQ